MEKKFSLERCQYLMRKDFSYLQDEEYVEKFERNDDPRMARTSVVFKNQLGISIIMGSYSYGISQELYEIAPLDKDGSLTGDMFDKADQGDDVLGCCTVEKVKYYINKFSKE